MRLADGGFYRGNSLCKGLDVRERGQASWRTGSSLVGLGPGERDGWRVNGDLISKILLNQDGVLLEGFTSLPPP